MMTSPAPSQRGSDAMPALPLATDTVFLGKLHDSLNATLSGLRDNPFTKNRLLVDGNGAPRVMGDEIAQALAATEGVSPDVRQCVNGAELAYKYLNDLTRAEQFELLDLAQDGGQFVGSFRVAEYVRTGGESYSAVDIVVYLTADGELAVTPIVKKAIVAGGASMVQGGLGKTTRNRVEKLSQLRRLGIPTIHIHGSDPEHATVYEGLYHDSKDRVFEDIKMGRPGTERHLAQLAHIAHALDLNGFDSMDFTSDVIFDGGRFLYLDGGADVGNPGVDPAGSTRSLSILCRNFPSKAALIEVLYGHIGRISSISRRTKQEVSATL